MPFTKTAGAPVKGQKVYVPLSMLCTVSSVDFRDGIYWMQIVEQPGAAVLLEFPDGKTS